MSVIEKALRWVVLGGIFALPFIVFIISDHLFFPYITGKNFAFRMLVEIITGAWLALALVLPHYRPKRSWLLGAFALFVTIIAIADAQGVYPFKSFWSNYERMDGWVTLAHLFAYFVVASSVLTTEKLWHALWKTSLFASVLMALYGMLQIIGITSLAAGFSSATRIDATFGNPIYLAAFMLFHAFIGAILFVREGKGLWSTSGKFTVSSLLAIVLGTTLFLLPHGASSAQVLGLLGVDIVIAALVIVSLFMQRSYLYGGVILLDTIVIFLTGTRGTMLGLFGGVVLAVLCYAIASESKRAWQVFGAILIVLGIGGGILWIARETQVVQNVGFLNRLSTVSISDPTVQARFKNWGMAMKGFEERPVLGWGQENYAIVFDKYYDPRMYNQEQWFDRVHNVVFDWLVAGGLLGLLGYLSLFASALWIVWLTSKLSHAERAILTGLFAAYFFHDLFVFDNISSYLLFATVLAYVAWHGGDAGAPYLSEKRFIPRDALPIVAACAVLGVWGTAWYVNAGALAANKFLLQALTPQSEGLTKNLEYFKQAISYGSYGTQEIREQLTQGAARLASTASVSNDVKQQLVQTAADEMMLMQKASPLDARFPLFLGVLYDSYNMYAEATPVLERAHALSPTKQTILYQIGSNKSGLGDTAGALAAFKEAFELEESNVEARIYYAAYAIRVQQDTLADELLAPIIPNGQAADPRIASAYVSRGMLAKAIPIWEAKIKANPQDAEGYLALASMYYEVGDKANTLATLEALGNAVPSYAAQAATLIEQVKSGKALSN